jgi:osmotically-inducible protein OsmY
MTDRELQQHVLDALDWDPGVDAAAIGVSADNGVVTLRGDVSTYAEKQEAERVALRVYGVKAVANDIVVRLASGHERTDTEIAQAAVAALKWNSVVPPNRVTVTVADGWVTLNGTLYSYHQSAAAERTVRDLRGVKGVSNTILLQRPVRSVSTTDVAAKIEAALKRSAEVDARRIGVSARDGKVVLTGNVRSWAEREDAERAAWAAPGVMEVDDRISVVPER